MTETWKPVPGYEGRYEVSDQGRVRSLRRTRRACYGSTSSLPGRVLKATPIPNGYLTVGLYIDNVKKTRLVHQLVAEAFIGPRPPAMQVCHGDGNQINNTLANLRYGTPSENHQDAVRHGTHSGLLPGNGRGQWRKRAAA